MALCSSEYEYERHTAPSPPFPTERSGPPNARVSWRTPRSDAATCSRAAALSMIYCFLPGMSHLRLAGAPGRIQLADRG